MCNKRPALAAWLAGYAGHAMTLTTKAAFCLPLASTGNPCQLPVASCQTLPYAIRPRNIFCMLVA